MAKLSAHGRELLRLVKVTPGEASPTRVTIALHADGWILRKLDWQNTSPYAPAEWGGTGWRRKGKVREGVIADRFLEVYLRAGFELVRSDFEAGKAVR